MSTDPIGITATLAHLHKINAPEQPCILCGAMTTGSVGVAGYFWNNLCQPCKSAEDAALWASLNLTGATEPNLGRTPSSSEYSAQTNAEANVDELTTSGQNLSKP